MPPRILYNAHIYTLDPARPTAQGLVLENGIVTHLLQNTSDVRVPQAIQEDMEGKTILPGLIDAHLHLKGYALSLKKVNCETTTKAACLERVAERASSEPPGTWILGHGWNQNQWQDGYGSKEDLDKIAPDHPVFLTAKSLHAAWVNTAALNTAGLTKNTSDPENGRLARDPQGRLTGILFENAIPLVKDHIPQPELDDVIQAIRDAQPALWKVGLTGVHDFDRRMSFAALQELNQSGELKLRVTKNIPLSSLDAAIELGLRSGYGAPMLHIGGVKAFADGALGSQTAAMLAPYLESENERGILMLEEEEIIQHSRRAARHGLSMAIHAIGDRANRTVLDAYQQLRREEETTDLPHLRHRIEHVQLLTARDIPRLPALNIIASMQPIHATSDMETAERYWGKRCRYSYAWKSLLDHDAVLAFGSDAPVESPNPFLGLYAAISRRKANGEPGPEGWIPTERLSLPTALQAYTTGAAYASGLEKVQGRLAPGFWGDLIVLDKDPFQVPTEKLAALQPIATMVNGEWVWQS